MKKIMILALVLTLGLSMAFIAGCNSGTSTTTTTSPATTVGGATSAKTASSTTTAAAVETTAGIDTPAATDKVFTLDELAKYDGQNGNPAYVAVSGVVYDVTDVPQWQNGTHQNMTAGKDLTQDITAAPHGTDILKDVPVVGTLAK